MQNTSLDEWGFVSELFGFNLGLGPLIKLFLMLRIERIVYVLSQDVCTAMTHNRLLSCIIKPNKSAGP